MSARICKRCGCPIVASDGDECELTAGWCALMAARRPHASEEDHLIADAVAEFSKLDDARKAAAREKAMVGQ